MIERLINKTNHIASAATNVASFLVAFGLNNGIQKPGNKDYDVAYKEMNQMQHI